MKEIKLNFIEHKDCKTGKRVLQLTPNENVCHRNYFYQKCFTNDGKTLLFAGDFDEGNLNYYLLNLKTQVARQITKGKGDNTFGGFLSHDDKYLYYVKNNSHLKRVKLEDNTEEDVYSSSSDWVSYGTWVANSKTTKMVGIEIHKDYWNPLENWDEFIKMYHTKPLCRLFTVDLVTGEHKVLHKERRWLGHPIYRPFDDNTVAFCHEGPHDLIESRIWFINEDGTNMRPGKIQEKGEHCTHEFWVPDGSKMIYVSFKDDDTQRYMQAVNPDTLENELLMEMPHCSHLMSNFDGSLVVGDGASVPDDVIDKDKHQFEADENIYVFDIKNKTVSVSCKHKTSWDVFMNNRQINHPHPSFCPKDERILYSSDCNGKPAVYLTYLK